MKQISLLFALASFAASHLQASTSDSLSTRKKQQVLSILHGLWVEAGYIEEVKKTKSPYNSQHALRNFVELKIDSTLLSGDSIEVAAPSIHEGYSFKLYLRLGVNANALVTNLIDYDTSSNFYELGYVVVDGVTTLLLYRYNKDKQLLSKENYKKVPANTEGAVQYSVNQVLISGLYKTKDSMGEEFNPVFSNDGIVFGLPDYSQYYVITDFAAEFDESVDQLCFDIQTKNQTCYAFEIKEDGLYLYELFEDPVMRGELVFKMLRE